MSRFVAELQSAFTARATEFLCSDQGIDNIDSLFGALTFLEKIVLDGNNLGPVIPSGVGNFVALQHL